MAQQGAPAMAPASGPAQGPGSEGGAPGVDYLRYANQISDGQIVTAYVARCI